MTRPPARRVTMLVANVKQFRAPFYPMLQQALAPLGVELSVVYSDPSASESTKGDSIELAAPLGQKVARLYSLDDRVMLQLPSLRHLARSDLIVIVQATGYLLNYPLLALSALRLKRVAFWGHGYNRQVQPDSLSERIKRVLARSTDWWFAYTAETTAYLKDVGVDPRKITTIENAIDTRTFRAEVKSVTQQEVDQARARFGFKPEYRVALYCGSLYPDKRLPFLFQVAQSIAEAVPGFRLLIVGSGVQSDYVRDACQGSSTLHYAGPLFGHDKAVCFRMSEIFLNPGLVGLGILDCFAAGLPFVTSKDGRHSPEIAYLEHGVNGLMIDGGADRFANAVIQALNDPEHLARLAAGAEAAASRYTVENMVKNVASGIARALELPK